MPYYKRRKEDHFVPPTKKVSLSFIILISYSIFCLWVIQTNDMETPQQGDEHHNSAGAFVKRDDVHNKSAGTFIVKPKEDSTENGDRIPSLIKARGLSNRTKGLQRFGSSEILSDDLSSRSFRLVSRSPTASSTGSREEEEQSPPYNTKDDPCLFAKRSNAMEHELQSSIRSSFSERSMASRFVQALSVNKLQFSSVGLHGRKEETHALTQCLEHQRQAGVQQNVERPKRLHNNNKLFLADDPTATTTVFRQVVWIAGASGAGKTKLAMSLQPQANRMKGAFVLGKYDLHSNDEPYAGIVAACRQLCLEYIIPKHTQKLKDDIVKEELSCPLLLSFIPELKYFWEAAQERNCHWELPQEEVDARTQEAHEAKQRFIYAFRRFISVISSHFSPLVLVLDDLQWADMASLELLEALIHDRLNPNLMIVGCYRSNEVSNTHCFSKLMRDLNSHSDNIINNHKRSKSSRSDSVFAITELQIGNLTEPDVHHILMNLFDNQKEPDATLPLAKICHRKTQGNAFFVHSFLSMLEKENMISFNLGTLSWTWDLNEIEKNSAATENVVQLMREKINKLPPQTCQLLQVVSCLGSTFHERTVHLVLKDCFVADTVDREEKETERKTETEAERVQQLLSQAASEWFLECVDDSQYRWVHDKVQEAAISLIPQEGLNSTKFQVGRILQQELTEQELSDSIFEVTNLLNNPLALSLPLSDRMEIAKLDLQGAHKARRLSAFKSAADYVGKGISLLSGDPALWRTPETCKLLVDLYSTGAEAEYACGNKKQAMAYCDEVLQHQHDGGLTIFDLLPVYHVQIYSLGQTEKAADALDLTIVVLKQLGCKFPKSQVARSVRALSFFGGSRAAKNAPSPHQISQLEPMKDRTKNECMKLLVYQGCEYAYCAKNSTISLLCASAALNGPFVVACAIRLPCVLPRRLWFLSGRATLRSPQTMPNWPCWHSPSSTPSLASRSSRLLLMGWCCLGAVPDRIISSHCLGPTRVVRKQVTMRMRVGAFFSCAALTCSLARHLLPLKKTAKSTFHPCEIWIWY
jgi:predicted ATPase